LSFLYFVFCKYFEFVFSWRKESERERQEKVKWYLFILLRLRFYSNRIVDERFFSLSSNFLQLSLLRVESFFDVLEEKLVKISDS